MVVSQLHSQIARAVVAGQDIDEIERSIIDCAPVAEDEKSALWLYAQALGEHAPVRRSRERELALLDSR